MAHKKIGQASFVEAFLRPNVGGEPAARADRPDGRLGAAGDVKSVRSGAWGGPPYPPPAMLKALFLQRWYSLSDEGLEEALSDRLSFRQEEAGLDQCFALYG